MIACRASRVLALIAAAALCAAPVANAAAQTGAEGPVKLAPPAKSDQPPQTQPRRPLQPPPGPPSPANPIYTPPTKIEPSVEVNPLAAPSPESAGVLDAGNGGFGADMWAGTTRESVERLLPALPVKAPSPVMRDLMRRLLLSIARAPAGEESGRSLIALRAERLAAMGDAKGMNQLLNVAPSQTQDEAMARTRVNGLLLSGDVIAACEQVNAQIREYTSEYWQRAFVFCQAEAGKREQARLSLALLRESATDKQQTFFQVASVLLGDSDKKVTATGDMTPLLLAMLKSAKQPIPPEVADSAEPPVLRAIADNAAADWEVRLAAAERAEAIGMIPSTELAQLYSQVSFSPEQVENALSSARNEGGTMARALLYQAAAHQTVPAARAEVVQEALTMARADGMFATSARVNAPLLHDIRPAAELMWLAADAGEALFAAHDCTGGTAWYELAASSTTAHGGDAVRAEAALWPLVILCDGQTHVPSDPAAVRKWLKAAQESGDPNWRARAGVMLSLLSAVGKLLDFGVWQQVIEPGHEDAAVPEAALWSALHDAADADYIGATVLFGLLAIGNDGPQTANPVVVGAAVRGLDAVGLNGVARRLAIEAALAHPFAAPSGAGTASLSETLPESEPAAPQP